MPLISLIGNAKHTYSKDLSNEKKGVNEVLLRFFKNWGKGLQVCVSNKVKEVNFKILHEIYPNNS